MIETSFDVGGKIAISQGGEATFELGVGSLPGNAVKLTEVQVVGGAYFFLPGRRALRYLAGLGDGNDRDRSDQGSRVGVVPRAE